MKKETENLQTLLLAMTDGRRHPILKKGDIIENNLGRKEELLYIKKGDEVYADPRWVVRDLVNNEHYIKQEREMIFHIFFIGDWKLLTSQKNEKRTRQDFNQKVGRR